MKLNEKTEGPVRIGTKLVGDGYPAYPNRAVRHSGNNRDNAGECRA